VKAPAGQALMQASQEPHPSGRGFPAVRGASVRTVAKRTRGPWSGVMTRSRHGVGPAEDPVDHLIIVIAICQAGHAVILVGDRLEHRVDEVATPKRSTPSVSASSLSRRPSVSMVGVDCHISLPNGVVWQLGRFPP
jgi:hypothetical protein